MIESLEDNEIFVFGSNLKGIHDAGAALTAKIKFGAIQSIGSGITGRCCAIPTKATPRTALPISNIEHHVNKFINYCEAHTNNIFLVTEIGCGLAGYSVKQIAPLFKRSLCIKNIFLPNNFVRELCKPNDLNTEPKQDVILRLFVPKTNMWVVGKKLGDYFHIFYKGIANDLHDPYTIIITEWAYVE